MSQMISGTQASLTEALNCFACEMHLGFTPVGFLKDGGIDFTEDDVPALEPSPLLVAPEMMPFNSGELIPELRGAADFVSELASDSGAGGSRFLDVMGDLQAALTIDGGLKRGKGGHIVGCVGEVIAGTRPPERDAARAMVREFNASRSDGYPAYMKTIRAMKSWHDYALGTDAEGPLKRHAFSRSIWYGLLVERTRFAGRTMAILGSSYENGPMASVEDAVLNYLRSAVLSLNSGLGMDEVSASLGKVVGGWDKLIGGHVLLNELYLDAKSLRAAAASFKHMSNWGEGYAVIDSSEDLAAARSIGSGNYVYAVTPAGKYELRLGATGIPHKTLQLDPERHHAFAAGRWVYDNGGDRLLFDGRAPDVYIRPDQEFVEARTGSPYAEIMGGFNTGYRRMISHLEKMGIPAELMIGGVSTR